MTRPLFIRAVAFFALATGFAIIPVAKNLQGASAEIQSTRSLRVAIIGLVGASTQTIESALTASLAKEGRMILLDDAQIKPALAAFGYDGSINLSSTDAKHLGAAMGCDFFIIGKTDSATRSERAGEAHEETFIAVMVVDARSGALAIFDFILQKATKREDAMRDAARALSQQTRNYVEKMMAFRAAIQGRISSTSEPVEDLADAEPAVGTGFTAPEFLNRVKPEFTQIADQADINATVEARVVFRANGEVGEIEIIRWAGFGLDESATRAIRQLKFKPATRNGQPINVRAIIRYNFRRVNQI